MKTIKVKKGKTKMIAHRGLSGLERENSLRAFVASCNRSYYGSECDIHYTKDKHLVICHDEFTDRVSNTKKIIKESTLQELQQVRLKEFNSDKDSFDMMLPTLEEYLMIHDKYQKKCIIEIKCMITDEDAQDILNRIKPYKKLVTFISFNLDALIKIRKLDKKIPMQFLSGKYKDELIDICKEHNLDIDILYSELNKERIETFKNNNIKVNAWTVNDKKICEELISYGIDYITTNILE